jgi:hypothetical protein
MKRARRPAWPSSSEDEPLESAGEKLRQKIQGECDAPALQPTLPGRLKESQRLRAVADQKVLGLLIMIENHFVSLATKA